MGVAVGGVGVLWLSAAGGHRGRAGLVHDRRPARQASDQTETKHTGQQYSEKPYEMMGRDSGRPAPHVFVR